MFKQELWKRAPWRPRENWTSGVDEGLEITPENSDTEVQEKPPSY